MYMEMHHIAWLQAHTDRTAEWLKARLADGFDVHHLDGDHSNNDPDNLILIEAADHMRLHGMNGVFTVKRVVAKGGGRPKGRVGPTGIMCYEGRQRGASWEAVGDLFGLKPRSALARAKEYAHRQNLPWPIPLPTDTPKATTVTVRRPNDYSKLNKEPDPYEGILKRFRHLPIDRARHAQHMHDTTVR